MSAHFASFCSTYRSPKMEHLIDIASVETLSAEVTNANPLGPLAARLGKRREGRQPRQSGAF